MGIQFPFQPHAHLIHIKVCFEQIDLIIDFMDNKYYDSVEIHTYYLFIDESVIPIETNDKERIISKHPYKEKLPGKLKGPTVKLTINSSTLESEVQTITFSFIYYGWTDRKIGGGDFPFTLENDKWTLGNGHLYATSFKYNGNCSDDEDQN